jgi:hypothetical protein
MCRKMNRGRAALAGQTTTQPNGCTVSLQGSHTQFLQGKGSWKSAVHFRGPTPFEPDSSRSSHCERHLPFRL